MLHGVTFKCCLGIRHFGDSKINNIQLDGKKIMLLSRAGVLYRHYLMILLFTKGDTAKRRDIAAHLDTVILAMTA